MIQAHELPSAGFHERLDRAVAAWRKREGKRETFQVTATVLQRYGALIEQAMARTGLSARALAALVDVDERAMRRWIAGTREMGGPARQLLRVLPRRARPGHGHTRRASAAAGVAGVSGAALALG